MEERTALINGKFNNKHSKYKSIKYTNVTLLIFFYLLEVMLGDLDGNSNNVVAVFITFAIARYIIREIFKDNPNFKYKVLKTIGVYTGVFILKNVLLNLLLIGV